jgi:hypothetical protein
MLMRAANALADLLPEARKVEEGCGNKNLETLYLAQLGSWSVALAMS